jgi:cytochrome c553
MTRAVALFAPLSRIVASVVFATSLGTACAADQAAPVAKPDPAKGADIVNKQCAACHAADGNTIGNAYPKLAGQHAQYLIKELTNFQVVPPATVPDRPNAMMGGMVSALSDDDKRNVAAYFEGQSLKPSAAKNKDTLELGRKIYRAGDTERNVPACAGCHGPTGAGIPAQYPRLGGQWFEYTKAQLEAFRSGARHNNAAMSTVAARLSDTEIDAVADYIAGLH